MAFKCGNHQTGTLKSLLKLKDVHRITLFCNLTHILSLNRKKNEEQANFPLRSRHACIAAKIFALLNSLARIFALLQSPVRILALVHTLVHINIRISTLPSTKIRITACPCTNIRLITFLCTDKYSHTTVPLHRQIFASNCDPDWRYISGDSTDFTHKILVRTEGIMEKSELDWSSRPIRLLVYVYDPKFISLLFTHSS